MKAHDIVYGLIRIPIDFALTLAAFLFAYNIRLVTDLIPGVQLPITASIFPAFDQYLISSSISAAILVLFFAAANIYSLRKPPKLSKQLYQISIATTLWLFLIISYYFITRTFPFSRLALLQTWLFTLILVGLGRIIIHYIQQRSYKKGRFQTAVLLVGSNRFTADFVKTFFKNPQYKCIGYTGKKNPNLKLPFRGSLNTIQKIIRKYDIEKIIQVSKDISQENKINLIEFCRENQIEYSFIPDQLEVQRTNIEIETLAGIPIIKLKPTPLDGWGRVLKRLFDFFGALAILLAISPIYLLICALIKIDDPKATVLFKFLDDGSLVKRVGQKGKLFTFYKFRTMKPNTHNLRYTDLAKNNTRGNSPLVKIKDDPRVTKIGKFLRRTSLDELPQLWNVLIGNMSLVGPRPHLPEEVAKYKNHHKFVLTIKPGITGIAQTSGRSDLDFEKEVQLDTYYIENWSLGLDIKILFRTISVIFKKFEE